LDDRTVDLRGGVDVGGGNAHKVREVHTALSERIDPWHEVEDRWRGGKGVALHPLPTVLVGRFGSRPVEGWTAYSVEVPTEEDLRYSIIVVGTSRPEVIFFE